MGNRTYRIVFLVLLFPLRGSGELLRKQEYEFSDGEIEYFTSLVEIYKGFSYIFHVTNESLYLSTDLLEVVRCHTNQTVVIYNADRDNYDDLIRPNSVSNLVNIILFPNPWTFARFISRKESVILYDVAVFLLYNQTMERYRLENNNNETVQFWDMEHIELAGNVLILDFAADSRIRLFSTCYYCGLYARTLYILDDSNVPSHGVNIKELLPRNMKNFQGHFFKVAFSEYFPYANCVTFKNEISKSETGNERICKDAIGVEASLLNVISLKLNFTYQISDMTEYGNNSVALFDAVVNREIDFAIGGISITESKMERATFTTTIDYQDVTLMYTCRIPVWGQITQIIMPFEGMLWLAILLALVLLTLCLYAFARLSPGRGHGNVITFLACMKITIQIILEQSTTVRTHQFQSRWSIVLLLTVLWLTCIQLDTAYKSKLSALFVRPPHEEANSLEQILAQGYDLVLDGSQLGFIELNRNDDPIVKLILNSSILTKDICSAFQHIATGHSALLSEHAQLQYNLKYRCADAVEIPFGSIAQSSSKLDSLNIRSGDNSLVASGVEVHQGNSIRSHSNPGYNLEKLRITRKPIRSSRHVWALQRAVPYWKAFDVVISHLKDGGFFDKWKKDALNNLKYFRETIFSKNNNVKVESSEVALSTLNLISYFSIFIVGNFIALFCFICEMFYFQYYTPL